MCCCYMQMLQAVIVLNHCSIDISLLLAWHAVHRESVVFHESSCGYNAVHRQSLGIVARELADTPRLLCALVL
jgi:hypothetical protein